MTTVVFLLLSLAGISMATYCLPLPIGPLSDYGNVLDRHGREKVSSLIEGARNQLGIEVYILASWENPYSDIDRYAYALLDAWSLARGSTLLAVFLKTGRDWEVKVLAGEETALACDQFAQRVQAGIANLVQHRRIEEAMVELFSILERQFFTEDPTSQPAKGGTGNQLLRVLLLIVPLVILAFFIHRRICPRCGRILRVRTSRAPYSGTNVIYYCRKCGYSRTKEGEG